MDSKPPHHFPQNSRPFRGFPRSPFSANTVSARQLPSTRGKQTCQSSNQAADRPLRPPSIEKIDLNDEAFPALSAAVTQPAAAPWTPNRSMPNQSINQSNQRQNAGAVPTDDNRVSRAGKSRLVDFSALLGSAHNSTATNKVREAALTHSSSSFTGNNKVLPVLHNPNLKGNALDSSVPTKLRGKERSTAKKKTPSALRKIILQNRETGETGVVKIDELPRAVKVEDCADLESCLDRADPTASSVPVKDVHSSFSACSDSSVIPPKPSHNRDRAFYCPFTVLPEMTSLAGEILDKLVFYQDRAYKQDPQLYKRRFICGFKDVAKHIDTKEIRLIFVASDIERVDGAGGITDQLEKIREKALAFAVPMVFVMKRRLLARKCRKPHVVSVVGIYNYDVAGTEVKRLLALNQEEEDVRGARQESNPAPSTQTTISVPSVACPNEP